MKLPAAVAGADQRVPERDRRYIYGGASPPAHPGYAIRQNRKGIRRTVSTFNIILLLFGIGGAIVVYVNNIITINTLSRQVGLLQQKYDDIVNENRVLQRNVDQKSTLERISPLAAERLALHPYTRQPVYFRIDWEKLRELERSLPAAH